MRRVQRVLFCAGLLTTAIATLNAQTVFPTLGSHRAGISSFTFLKIGVDPRATALGESFVAIADDASSLFWNPAGIVQGKESEALFSHTAWFVDIDHVFAGLMYRLTSSDGLGLSFTSLYTDPIEITTELQPFGTGRSYSYSDIGIGLTYARRMSDQFSFGVTARYLHERIAEVTVQNLVLDLGTYYHTGFSTARFAIVLSNFGGNSKTSGIAHSSSGAEISSFEEFSPPTIFRIGFAFEPINQQEHRLTSSIQLNHPNDNAEHLSIGLEYGWQQSLFLRVGHQLNVEEQPLPSIGVGGAIVLGEHRFQIDYSAVSYRLLGVIHRISFTVGFTD